MNKSTDVEWLRKRLDAILLLLMEAAPDGTASTTAKIERLLAFGFSKPEIAEILGKKLNYITAVTSNKKRSTSTVGSGE